MHLFVFELRLLASITSCCNKVQHCPGAVRTIFFLLFWENDLIISFAIPLLLVLWRIVLQSVVPVHHLCDGIDATLFQLSVFVYLIVLCLGEMELIFLIATLLQLCFVLVGRKIDNAAVFWQLLSSARTASRLSAQRCLLTNRLEVGKILGGDVSRTADPN